jgi:uncharacterized protein (DUF433 family)
MTDNVSYNISAANITKTQGVCGGKPCIAGRRIPVQNVYIWYEYNDMTPDQIASQHDLTLGQVHAALSYSYTNIGEIRDSIRKSEELAAEIKKQYPSKLKQKLANG